MVGLGCWQLGSDRGRVDDGKALDILHGAVDAGVTVLDTADVYGDGRSERSSGGANAAAAAIDPVPDEVDQALAELYDGRIRQYVHSHW